MDEILGTHKITSCGKRKPANTEDEADDVTGSVCLPAAINQRNSACRSTSNSAFFSPSPRTTRRARLNNQRISRQAILISTWSANHHRARLAGEQAGQRQDRVSGRLGFAASMLVLGAGLAIARALYLNSVPASASTDAAAAAFDILVRFIKTALRTLLVGRPDRGRWSVFHRAIQGGGLDPVGVFLRPRLAAPRR
ncbi:MAG: hypothetical protein ACHP9Z_01575 [Streptosporangiales bacterium]